MSTKKLTPKQSEILIDSLKARFGKNMDRHKGYEWAKVEERLMNHPEKLWSLSEMERTGGEPDVVSFDKTTGEYVFYDCSAESPSGRRNACYDRAALEARKNFKPKTNAMDLAQDMGIKLLTEEEYKKLQELEAFDTKTSSWIQTQPAIRKLGGALFADRRYNAVFIYHNGADSYYAARGFRGKVRI